MVEEVGRNRGARSLVFSVVTNFYRYFYCTSFAAPYPPSRLLHSMVEEEVVVVVVVVVVGTHAETELADEDDEAEAGEG